MTEEQFNELGYSVRLVEPKNKRLNHWGCNSVGRALLCTEEVVGSSPIMPTIPLL